ncbi:type II toxin-antitoxin system PemK/MazF family toxin [Corynebacterium guangdongense]|uniref:PemK-like, MazF-like toxin of type II toxin-antitoxin system n=1 Tax=Corynebacterium guangdongense TaxID=1783348 RepID=A0ABU1ZZ33_9CORY|nr:type II toxin-antitoxin system PemK/MazF family toxin [Corynebacterium guangdongense]MDR7330020.1 hypothetical protein [Corynebacterium guangdongense]WJZ18578.1 hypothetical protein CGUA_10120 [Corynebacterium guangdongense]
MGFGADRTSREEDSSAQSRGQTRRSRRQRRAERKHTLHGAKLTALDEGLATLRQRLGFTDKNHSSPVEEKSDSRRRPHRTAAPLRVSLTREHPRVIFYTPDVDGQADPGEVVWFWAPGDDPADPPQERAMLVVGRSRSRDVLGLLISPNEQHADDEDWMEVGVGYWDNAGRPSWIRLDHIIEVPESALRREGALFPRGRFERIASALRTRFGWA